MSGFASASPRRGPLHGEHEALGAKFGEFGGWSMPLEYSGGGVLAEHRAVRESVGVFDVSHMGVVLVADEDPAAALNRVLTNDLTRVPAGSAQYTLLCDQRGGVVDDLIAYRSSDEVMLVMNAANTQPVIRALKGILGPDCSVTDTGGGLAILAIQGPRSAVVLEDLGLPTDLPFLTFRDVNLAYGGPVTVARTGYTGEIGFELVVPSRDAVRWWSRILASVRTSGGLPCGLGARDVLRTEMGYPLYGHEISEEITPVQAGLTWAIGWEKPEFIGRSALLKERSGGPSRRAWGIRCEGRAIPRPGMSVTTDHGTGVITSGTFSPTLAAGIGLALLPPEVTAGSRVEVDVRGRSCPAEVVKTPLVDADPRREPDRR